VLRKTGGKAPGVAHTRLLLVVAWIAFQSIRLTDGSAGAVFSALWIVPHAVVPALFAVLGFCLAHAAAERSAREFLLDRVRRAGPVLLVAVMVSALVLGPAVTTGGLRAYVSDPTFAQYFLILVGWPRFELPGVFEFNDYAGVVNEALWLPPCFAIVVLSALGAMRSRAPRWIALAATTATLAIYLTGEAAGLIPSPGGSVIRNSFVASGLAAIFAGQCGTLGYLWRERLPIGWPVLLGSVVALGALALVAGPGFVDLPGAPIAIALLAGAGALAASARRYSGSWIAARAAPVLHGAMLFAFPLQQLAADLGPGRQSAPISLALSLPLAAALAWGLHWVTVRVGLAPKRAEPDLGELPPTALPDLRRPRYWKNLFRKAAAGLGLAVFVAVAGVIVILITIAALKSDPIGV